MTKQQNKPGRPPITFSPDYIEQAYNYCLLGANDDAQLGKLFKVPAATIFKWRKDYPDFASSIKRGRIMADANVAESLYRRATGCQYTETTIRKLKSESGEIQSVETVTVTREIPPDTAACIFWLKNRQPGKWRDKVEYTDEREPEKTDSDTSSQSTADKG